MHSTPAKMGYAGRNRITTQLKRTKNVTKRSDLKWQRKDQ